MAYQEKNELLTNDDRKQLSKNLIGAGVFAVFSGFIFFMILTQVLKDTPDFMLYIVVGFGVLFFGIVVSIAASALLDLSSGQKLIITGKVTNKEVQQNRSRNSKNRSRPKHYLYFGDKRVAVQYQHYQNVNVGDEIALHYAKRSSLSLQVEKLHSTGSPQKEEQAFSIRDQIKKRQEAQKNLTTKEYPLTESDLKILARHRNKKLFQNIGVMIFFSVFALAFSFVSFVNTLFIIPVVIFLAVIFFTLRSAFKCVTKYVRDKRLLTKVAIVSNVNDKQVSSTNGHRRYSATTDYGTFKVNEKDYHTLQRGDLIVSFHGKHSNWLIETHIQPADR